MKRKPWVLGAVAVALSAAATGGVIALSSTTRTTGAGAQPPPNVAPVERGDLSDSVSEYGTLTFRARSDGSPYAVINQARGTYTALPTGGATVDCGHVLYRVDDHPVVLLCGSTPAYRSPAQGDSGPDVAELNANLVALGYATRAQLDPSSRSFGPVTAAALKKLQAALGDKQDGTLDLGEAVVLPEAARVATVIAALGASAQRGSPVLSATSDTPEVQVGLDPSQQDAVKNGDTARITLPGNMSVTGRVDRFGAVGQLPSGQSGSSGQNGGTGDVTVPVYLSLDHPELARGYDAAPVQVEITTTGVADVLSVPVTAIVARSGGGFAVEVAGADGRRVLVTVTLGLVDTAAGRVQVDGSVHVGDHVVVPAS